MTASDQPPAPPGWYVQLNGHLADLADWQKALTPPDDPYALRLRSDTPATHLWSSRFQNLASAEEVAVRARPIIDALNGLMAFQHDSEPVSAGSVVGVGEDGCHHTFLHFEESIVARESFDIGVIDREGNFVPRRCDRAAHSHRSLLKGSEQVASLFEHYGKARQGDWYELYKTIEAAENIVGGERALIKKMLGVAVKQVKVSANEHRHVTAKFAQTRSAQRVGLDEAVGILPDVIRAALDCLREEQAGSKADFK